MKTYLLILLGAFIGASSRYYLEATLGGGAKSVFFINISGCFLIGLLFGFINHLHWKIFLLVGLLGSYTTFSTYCFGIIALLEKGNYLPATFYGIASPVLGLLACWLGLKLNFWLKSWY